MYTADRYSIRRNGDEFILDGKEYPLGNVYFLPSGLAYREDGSHGKLVPLVGYRCIDKKEDDKEARQAAGRSRRNMPAWADIDGAIREWSKDRGNELIKRGWSGPLERGEAVEEWPYEAVWRGERE